MAEVIVSPQNLKVVGIEGEPYPWSDNYGNDNLQYDVKVMDESGTVHDAQWSKRVTSPEPEMNEVVFAKLEDTTGGQYPPKLRTVKQDGHKGGGGGQRKQSGKPAGKGGGHKFDPDDPYWKSQNAMKGRSAAQQRAVDFLHAKIVAAQVGDPNSLLSDNGRAALVKQLTPAGLRELIDWFAQDVDAAGQRASASPVNAQTQQTTSAAPAQQGQQTIAQPDMTPPPASQPRADSGDLPPDTTDLAAADPGSDAAPPSDDDIPF